MLGDAWSLLGAASQCECLSKLSKPYMSHRGLNLDYSVRCVRMCSNHVQSKKDSRRPEFQGELCRGRLRW